MNCTQTKLALTLGLFAATVSVAQAQTNSPTEPSPLPPVTVIGVKPALQQPETIAASVVAGDLFERGGFNNTRELTAIAPNTSLFDGKTISFVPEFTGNLAGQFRFPFGLYARVEVQALGDYFLTEGNTAKQSAFGLLNARIGYDTKHWSIYVCGRNVLDKEYAANALDLRGRTTRPTHPPARQSRDRGRGLHSAVLSQLIQNLTQRRKKAETQRRCGIKPALVKNWAKMHS